MSVIGNNIKKIRSVKKLNQQAFADMFEIKRASVGAYEEGRADPKIKTIIEIANKFGITLDLFMTKDLKVNDLYRFDIFREDLTKDVKHNLIPQRVVVDVLAIPFIRKADFERYLKSEDRGVFLSQVTAIQLPLARGKSYAAFEVLDHYMQTSLGGLAEGDIFIGESSKDLDVSQIEVGKVYLFEFKDTYVVRKVVAKNMSQLKLQGESDLAYLEIYNLKDLTKIWRGVKVITNKFSMSQNLTNELKSLQEELRLLKLKMQ